MKTTEGIGVYNEKIVKEKNGVYSFPTIWG